MERTLRVSGLCLAGLLVIAGGCKSMSRHGNGYDGASADSLYGRLSGEKAIALVVSEFVDRSATDARVNVTRKGHPHTWDPTAKNVQHLKDMLTEQLCDVTGGPQRYTGRDMITVHMGMQINDAEFAAAGENLVAAMNKYNVPKREQDEVLQIISAQKKDIVGR